jgi:hypothetical protein
MKYPDDFVKAFHDLDLAQRPYICFMSANAKKKLLEAIPDITEKVVIHTIENISDDEIYVVDRKKLETDYLNFDPINVTTIEPEDWRCY